MRFAQHEDRWTIWGYPDDPEWDRRTYDIGYTTDSGTGTVVASGLTLEDATTILASVRTCLVIAGAKDRWSA